MAEKIDEIDIIVLSGRVFGFQKEVSDYTIRAMVRLLELGIEPPRVDVVRVVDNYQILYAFGNEQRSHPNYGGHHRAVSRLNYRGGLTKLPCNLWDEHPTNPLDYGINWINCRNIYRRINSGMDFGFFRILNHLPKNEVESLFGSFSFLEEECKKLTGKTISELKDI